MTRKAGRVSEPYGRTDAEGYHKILVKFLGILAGKREPLWHTRIGDLHSTPYPPLGRDFVTFKDRSDGGNFAPNAAVH